MTVRVVIAGSRWFGAEVLRLALAEGVDVVGVAAPGVEDGLAGAAMSARLRLRTTGAVGLDELCADYRPDLILAAHCHFFVTEAARAAAGLGCLAYHPSLLPRHRGRDAVEWTIRFNDPVAGGSLYWMDDGADTGPLALQEWCWVQPGDTAQTLWRRDLAPMGLRLFREALRRLQAGVRLPSVPQLDCAATWEPSLAKRPLRAINSG